MASTMGSVAAILTAPMMHPVLTILPIRTILTIRKILPIQTILLAVMNKPLERAINSLLSGSIPAVLLYTAQHRDTRNLQLSVNTEIRGLREEMHRELHGIKDRLDKVEILQQNAPAIVWQSRGKY